VLKPLRFSPATAEANDRPAERTGETAFARRSGSFVNERSRGRVAAETHGAAMEKRDYPTPAGPERILFILFLTTGLYTRTYRTRAYRSHEFSSRLPPTDRPPEPAAGKD